MPSHPATEPPQPAPTVHRPVWSGIVATTGALVGVAALIGFSFGSIAVAFAIVTCLSDVNRYPELYPPGLLGIAYFCALGLYIPERSGQRIALMLSAALVTAAIIAMIMTRDSSTFIVSLFAYAILHGVGVAGWNVVSATDRYLSEENWLRIHRAADRCPYCLYSTVGLTAIRCPECGNSLHATAEGQHVGSSKPHPRTSMPDVPQAPPARPPASQALPAASSGTSVADAPEAS